MIYQSQLSDAERTLVLDLLQSERKNLHPEIRRSTMTPDVHEDLQQRLKMVDDLIQRLGAGPVQG